MPDKTEAWRTSCSDWPFDATSANEGRGEDEAELRSRCSRCRVFVLCHALCEAATGPAMRARTGTASVETRY